MDLLSTASALLALLSAAAAGFLSWQANTSATDARDAANELRATQGVVKSHGLSIAQLYTAVKRIDGKLGAMKQHGKLIDPQDRDLSTEGPRLPYDEVDPEFAAELAAQQRAGNAMPS